MTGVIYNSIIVVTDRLTKYIYFISYLKSFLVKDLAYMFYKHVITNHRFSQRIINDRDKLFTFRFWKLLIDLLGVHHKLLTVYYLQTDGQTERLNQIMEQYFRCYINYQQDNWVKLLLIAQLAYNNIAISTTGISPFFANYGYHLFILSGLRGMELISE
jgi:hypothetical protein